MLQKYHREVGMFEVRIVGNLVTEPEVKTGKTGKPYCSVKFVTHIRNVRVWVRLCAFGDETRLLAGAFHANDKVYVEGRLIQVEFKGKIDLQVIPTLVRLAEVEDGATEKEEAAV